MNCTSLTPPSIFNIVHLYNLFIAGRFGLGSGECSVENDDGGSHDSEPSDSTVSSDSQYLQYQYNSPTGGGSGGSGGSGGGGSGGGSGRQARRHSVATMGGGWEQQQFTYETQYGAAANTTTTTTAVQPPPRPMQRTRVSQLPHGWIQYWCPIEQTYYYYHPTTDHSTWEKPAQVSSSELPGEAQFRRKRFRLLCEIGAWGSSKETPLEVALDRHHMVYDSVA